MAVNWTHVFVSGEVGATAGVLAWLLRSSISLASSLPIALTIVSLGVVAPMVMAYAHSKLQVNASGIDLESAPQDAPEGQAPESEPPASP